MEEAPTRKPKLLLQRAQDKTKGLRPDQIDEVSQPTQTLSARSVQIPRLSASNATNPDVPLIFPKAVGVNLFVDQDTFLLEQCQTLQLFWCSSSYAATCAIVVFRWGWRLRLASLDLFVGRWDSHGDHLVLFVGGSAQRGMRALSQRKRPRRESAGQSRTREEAKEKSPRAQEWFDSSLRIIESIGSATCRRVSDGSRDLLASPLFAREKYPRGLHGSTLQVFVPTLAEAICVHVVRMSPMRYGACP